MELILINSKKIKAMLDKKDMEHYRIKMYAITNTAGGIREAFFDVLDDIKTQTGFDTLSRQSILQVYPSKDGGCEIYLTRLANTEGESMTTDTYNTNEGCKYPAKKRSECEIYVFSELCHVIDVCRILCTDSAIQNSSLYSDGGKYYLCIEHECENAYLPNTFTKLSDFGTKLTFSHADTYLKEHFDVMIEKNAVGCIGAKIK